jgi:pyruvate formate lyase activating enzyme
MVCGKCAEACEYDALMVIGKPMSIEQVIKVVERDRPFYETSGGGMTISGGEALFQPEFTLALLKAAKQKDISTCIETSGFGNSENLKEIAGYTDIFLYDCKHTDAARHKAVTGVDRDKILENLYILDKLGKDIILRLPIIPGINDNEEHFAKVGILAESLDHVLQIEVLPYHPLGLSKAALIQKEMPYATDQMPESKTVDSWVETIKKYTNKKVIQIKS